MPFEINLGVPPAGCLLEGAPAGEQVTIGVREFTSTEDGQDFIQRLEGLTSSLLQRSPHPINPSQVDNLLAIYHCDGRATVYVNELELQSSIRLRKTRTIKEGDPIMRDDVVDIESLRLGVDIPDEAGMLFVFSVGWRKGLYYDLGPIGRPDSQPRQYDLAVALGQVYCHVAFQERFSITEGEWESLFETKWFPFAGLRDETISSLIAHIRSGRNPDEKLDDVVDEVRERVLDMLDSWRSRSSFIPHLKFLERAVERFQNGDPISCTCLLFNRIEGILRTHHSSLGTVNHPSQENLSQSAVATRIGNEKSLLLPHRFEDYLHDVYFANFDPNGQDIDVSRNSVGHGVASASNFNWKSAVIGILIVHQLFYFVQR